MSPIWKLSQESLWLDHVTFIPTQHPSHGLLHAHPPSLAFQRAALKSKGIGRLSGIQQAIKKADGRNKNSN